MLTSIYEKSAVFAFFSHCTFNKTRPTDSRMELIEEVWTILFTLIVLASVVGNLAVLWTVTGRFNTESRQHTEPEF